MYCSIVGSGVYHIIRGHNRTLCGMRTQYRSLNNWATLLSEECFPRKKLCRKCSIISDSNQAPPAGK